jgi:hypothetical protein
MEWTPRFLGRHVVDSDLWCVDNYFNKKHAKKKKMVAKKK